MKKMMIIISVLAVAVLPTSASALQAGKIDYFDTIGAYYYDPEGANRCSTSATGSYDGKASAGLSDHQSAWVDTYHNIAESLSIQYGIPWETVMAQGIMESGAGISDFGQNRNNFFGIGAFDSNPDNAFYYDTPEEGWKGYYENIRKTETYRQHGAFTHPDDPYAYMHAILEAGYAGTNYAYYGYIEPVITAVINRANEKGWETSAELVKSHPEMVANAKALQAGDGDESDLEYSAGDNCISRGNGDINRTAIELSWPEAGHDPWNDPKPEYREALAATGVNQLGDACSMNGNSCDAFVATVLRYSGADENVVCCGAANMLTYFTQHTIDLYEEIPNLGNTSNMQPGDIRVHGGHVELLVQLDDGSFRIASASHCDRTGDHATGYYPDSSFHIFRRNS